MKHKTTDAEYQRHQQRIRQSGKVRRLSLAEMRAIKCSEHGVSLANGPCRLCGTGAKPDEKWIGRLSSDYSKVESK